MGERVKKRQCGEGEERGRKHEHEGDRDTQKENR